METLRVAEALGKSKDPSDKARALFYQGGALGLRGCFEVTQHHWLDAYRSSKRGLEEIHGEASALLATKPSKP